MSEEANIRKFETESGIRIYQIPLVLFPPAFIGYSYLVIGTDVPTLIDTGSGFDQSNDDLLSGIQTIQENYEKSFAITDVGRILITHGHIDHFGGAKFVREQTGQVEIGIHPLDRRVLTAYEERVIVATKDLKIYLERAGVKESTREKMMEMYGFAKRHVSSIPVDFDLTEDVEIDGMAFIHAPGHCPGQVCIRLENVLFSADHILSKTTPHQAPESITHYTGLGHYLDALKKVSQVEGIRLGLGGHEDAIEDIYVRITEIHESHQRKLNRVLDIVRDEEQPLTITEISKRMYPQVEGYNILLALEETGAHIEYLYQHAQLQIANLAEVEQEDNPALLYELIQ